MNSNNLTEQNEVINLTHIENHVSPRCIVDGMSVSEHAKEKLYQVEIARLKTEKLSMQVRIDELMQGVNFALSHCEGLRGFHAELDDYVNMASKTILGAI